MKRLLTYIFLLHFSFNFSLAQDFNASSEINENKTNLKNQNLELISDNPVKQLIKENIVRFDLSGMVFFQGNILAIADKEWNNFIYRIENKVLGFDYQNFLELCTDFNLDIEGIDYCNNRFYLVDESSNNVFEVFIGSCEMHKLEIPWENKGIDRSDWENKGFEGIAVDGINQVMYLAKEREPRRIFRIDLKTMDISEPFTEQLLASGGHDISEMKYENGNLYILERGLGQITRIDVKSKEKVSVSYQKYVFKDGQRWFKNANPQFGMAEAMVLKNDEIWLGIDNNGDPVSDFGKSYGLLDGNNTVIIIFKRPVNF